MPNIVIVGAQWGDEGKGKVVDLVAPCVDVVARYSGGPNAGHTIVTEDRRFVLQLVPSGVLRSGKKSVIGCGTVVDPVGLVRSWTAWPRPAIALDRALHLPGRPRDPAVPPGARSGRGPGADRDHRARAWGRPTPTRRPDWASASATSSTRPSSGRSSRRALPVKNQLLRARGRDPFEVEEVVKAVSRRRRAAPARTSRTRRSSCTGGCGTGRRCSSRARRARSSTWTTAPTPTSPRRARRRAGRRPAPACRPPASTGCSGVTKAYATRVGAGPFPDRGDRRPRRADPGARQGVRVRHRPATPLRVVRRAAPAPRRPRERAGHARRDEARRAGSLPRRAGGRGLSLPRDDASTSGRATSGSSRSSSPCSRSVPGWLSETAGLRTWEDLPARAHDYLRWLEDLIECEISLVSTGPGRDETILVEPSSLTRWFPDLRRLCLR